MILDSFILVVGLVLLIVGGDILVRGAASLARHIGLSTLVIGLTVVAFGTSAPELAVNLQAALLGSGGVSFGNIIGSNIANIGLILGIAALVSPLVIRPTIVRREVPMMLLATASEVGVAAGADMVLRRRGMTEARPGPGSSAWAALSSQQRVVGALPRIGRLAIPFAAARAGSKRDPLVGRGRAARRRTTRWPCRSARSAGARTPRLPCWARCRARRRARSKSPRS